MTNVADSIWKPTIGEGEYHNITPVDIIDPSDNFLVDPVTGDNVISTDLEFIAVANTVWAENPAS